MSSIYLPSAGVPGASPGPLRPPPEPAPRRVVPMPRARRAARPAPAPVAQGDVDGVLERGSRFASIEWSMVYVGFLAYIFTITTYQVPIAQPAIAVALLGLLLQKEKFRFPPLIVGFMLFTIWCSLGIFHSRWPEVVQEEVVNQAKLGLILVAAVNSLRTRAQIRFFITFWVVLYVLYPVRGSFVNYFVAGYSTFGRALWNQIYGNPNDLAALTLLQIGLSAGLLVSQPKGWIRRGALVALVLSTLLVLMTQSRAGMLGLGMVAMLTIAGSRRRLRAIVMIMVVGGVAALFAPPEVWDRMSGLKNVADTSNLGAVDAEGSAEERFAIWQTSWKILADHPVTGVGWGAYARMNAIYAPLDGTRGRRLGAKDTHSTYFNTLAETGYPGFLLLLAVVAGTIIDADRVRRRCKALMPVAAQQLYFLEVGLAGFLVAGIFGSFAKLSFFYVTLGLLYVLSRACEADLKKLQAAPLAHPLLRSR